MQLNRETRDLGPVKTERSPSIVVTRRQSRAPRSVYSYRSAVAPSVASTHRSKVSRKNPYPRYPDDFYWTNHWSKTIGPSEIHYSASEKPYRNGHDRYNNKYNGKYSDRESAKGYSDRESKLSRY
ncbi:Uncharacterized protein OBRU01_03612 [Operophtera brumata]|uniref:Uncharacterized protein n=1 Tax=Operophtera brumata TaxID=104452 RepID=A0A0L7LRF3_OPEBR|nr:Uncharacterized protein OBRU01_03612 [Operophtera brumata]